MTIEKDPATDQRDRQNISLKELFYIARDWFVFLLRNWVLLCALVIIGGGLGFWYASIKKPVYTATTTFVLEEEKNSSSGLGSLAGLASMAGVDINAGGGGIFQGDNIIELYKSRRMVEKTLLTSVVYNGKREMLINKYIEFHHLRDKWGKGSAANALRFDTTDYHSIKTIRLRDSIMGNIVGDITKNCLNVAKPDKKLSIIVADVKSEDEFFSKNFNEQIVKNVNDFYVQTKTKKSLYNVKILQQKTDSVRAVMNGAIYSSASVADATPNLNPTRQIQRIAPMQKSQFSAETNKAILSSLVQNLEMAKISLRKDAPLIQVVDEPVYPLAKKSFGKLKGLVLGGFLFGFIGAVILTLKRFFSTFSSDERL